MTARIFLLALAVAVPAAAQPFRDADCNGAVDERDRAAVVTALFGVPTACAAADVNRDERPDAADLIAFARGPHVAFVGIASPDGRPAPSLGTLPDGAPVYYRNSGFGFLLVAEAAQPQSGAPVGTSTFDLVEGDPSRRPDFQVLADRTLGDGSRDVCDEFGIPGQQMLDFTPLTQGLSNAINDLSCRFEVATRTNSACTQNQFGQLGFVSPATRAQFCLAVQSGMAFPPGDTRLAIQVRDQSGLLGPVREMVLRVGSGPFPPTFTPLPPTETPTATATWTPSPTATFSRTASHTPTVTLTRTPTRTATRTATVTASPSPSITATRSVTPTVPPSATPSRTVTRTATPVPGTPTNTPTGPRPTATQTATVTRTGTRTATPQPTTAGPTATRTRTATAAGSPTRTATRTRTSTATQTVGPTFTVTRTPTIAPTPSPTVNAIGPTITFFGLTRADDMLLEPSHSENGVPVYRPAFGFAFSLIVEAKPGPSRAGVGTSTFSSGPPDLQVQVTRPLGDGSTFVCDDAPPNLGGVPAIDPPDFTDETLIADTLNDLACRFIDGSGEKLGRQCGDTNACVLGSDGLFGCVTDATIQFCGFIGQATTFPPGDTLVSVRVRDARGNVGAVRQLVVRVQ